MAWVPGRSTYLLAEQDNLTRPRVLINIAIIIHIMEACYENHSDDP